MPNFKKVRNYKLKVPIFLIQLAKIWNTTIIRATLVIYSSVLSWNWAQRSLYITQTTPSILKVRDSRYLHCIMLFNAQSSCWGQQLYFSPTVKQLRAWVVFGWVSIEESDRAHVKFSFRPNPGWVVCLMLVAGLKPSKWRVTTLTTQLR